MAQFAFNWLQLSKIISFISFINMMQPRKPTANRTTMYLFHSKFSLFICFVSVVVSLSCGVLVKWTLMYTVYFWAFDLQRYDPQMMFLKPWPHHKWTSMPKHSLISSSNFPAYNQTNLLLSGRTSSFMMLQLLSNCIIMRL